MKRKKYYQIELNAQSRTADIFIYGEITSWPIFESDVSSFDIVNQINELDVDIINVNINSPGGEVGEAIAIYNALKKHKATVNTYCDGFACSAASIIFCAGSKRYISDIAMLMIHNAMTATGYANADELRKIADDIEKINQSSIKAYISATNLDEDKIVELMDAETWLTADEALEYGFATDIVNYSEDTMPVQSAMPIIRQAIFNNQNENNLVAKVDGIMQDIKSILEFVKPAEPPKTTLSFFEQLKNIK